MDRKNLRLLLTALIILLAIFLGMELVSSRQADSPQPTTSDTGLPPNMLPMG